MQPHIAGADPEDIRLQVLERAGIARKVAERSKRGGTGVLYQVPGSLPVTASVLLFRIPRSASQHPDVPGGPA